MLQLQFWTDVKTQRKVASIKTTDYHTQNNALHKKLTQVTLSQQASGYVQTPESNNTYPTQATVISEKQPIK